MKVSVSSFLLLFSLSTCLGACKLWQYRQVSTTSKCPFGKPQIYTLLWSPEITCHLEIRTIPPSFTRPLGEETLESSRQDNWGPSRRRCHVKYLSIYIVITCFFGVRKRLTNPGLTSRVFSYDLFLIFQHLVTQGLEVWPYFFVLILSTSRRF